MTVSIAADTIGIFKDIFLLIKCLNLLLGEGPQNNQAQGERRRKLKLGLLNATFSNYTERILKTSKKFCSGKVVSILEGGYDLEALRDSTKSMSMR